MTGLSGFGARPTPRTASGGVETLAGTRTTPAGYGVLRGARVALASALLMCASGCLLPYCGLYPEPPVVNSMPVILPESVVPQPTPQPIEAFVGRGCQYRTFSGIALDYDGAEQLHYKWILQANIAISDDESIVRTFELVEGTVGASEVPIDTIVEGLSTEAPLARSYKDFGLDLTRERLLGFLSIEAIDTAETHLLEVFVSDRPFLPGVANTTPQTPDGQATQPAHSVYWLLDLETGDCLEGT